MFVKTIPNSMIEKWKVGPELGGKLQPELMESYDRNTQAEMIRDSCSIALAWSYTTALDMTASFLAETGSLRH